MRVGIVGWACKTGIGMMLRDLWDFGVADEWLAPAHPNAGWCRSVCPPEAIRCNRMNDLNKYRRFMDSIDVLLFVEHNDFLLGIDLVAEAKRRKMLVCCIPMMEFLPLAPWVAQVDMMWAVSEWTRDELVRVAGELSQRGLPCSWAENIVGCRWGVDVDRFQFRQRDKANRFIFLNGHGGVMGRKGAEVLARAVRFAHNVPLVFKSQTRVVPPMPTANVQVDLRNTDDKFQLYEEGDVLLAPSRWEGLGLQLFEAQACGLPVVTSDAPPMNACHPIECIPGSVSKVTLTNRTITAFDADPRMLALIMMNLQGKDISQQSQAARQYIEQVHSLKDVLAELEVELASRAGSQVA